MKRSIIVVGIVTILSALSVVAHADNTCNFPSRPLVQGSGMVRGFCGTGR